MTGCGASGIGVEAPTATQTGNGQTPPTPRFAAVIPNAAYQRTGAIRQAAGRGVTANGQLIAMRFSSRAPQSPKPCAFLIFRDGRRV